MKFIADMEMKLIEVLADVEGAGYAVDVNHFREIGDQLTVRLRDMLADIRKTAGAAFNPNSPKQLVDLLFGKLGLTPIKKTPGGSPSTDDETLTRYAASTPVAGLVQQYRTLTKLNTTYCQKIPSIVGDDGRLYVEFNQLEAETGRIASKSVIQTLPKSDDYNIRQGFRAAAGHKLVGADYVQQELQILAQVSGDENMIAAVQEDIDLHGLAAVKVFKLDCPPNEVKLRYPAERNRVKAIQFGLVYGISPYGLASGIGCKIEEAEQLIKNYFQQFPAIERFIKKIHADVVRDGYVDDVFGRRRYLLAAKLPLPRKKWANMSEEEKKIVQRVNAAKRQAQNFAMQGAAATITKLAMIRCHEYIKTQQPSIKMILTLHDELHFEVPDALVEEFAAALPGLMCDLGVERFGFTIPFRAEVRIGETWADMQTVKGTPCQQ